MSGSGIILNPSDSASANPVDNQSAAEHRSEGRTASNAWLVSDFIYEYLKSSDDEIMK